MLEVESLSEYKFVDAVEDSEEIGEDSCSSEEDREVVKVRTGSSGEVRNICEDRHDYNIAEIEP